MEGFDTGSLGNARVGGYDRCTCASCTLVVHVVQMKPVPWSEAKLMTLYHGRYISWLIYHLQ